jgi:hypothetical protein
MFEGAAADKSLGPTLGRVSTRALTIWLPALLHIVALVVAIVCVSTNEMSQAAHNTLCALSLVCVVAASTLPNTVSLLFRREGVLTFHDMSGVGQDAELSVATSPSKRIGLMAAGWVDLVVVPVGIAASPHVLGGLASNNSIDFAAQVMLLHYNTAFAEGTFWLVVGLGGLVLGLVGYCGWVLYRETSSPYHLYDDATPQPGSIPPTLLTALFTFMLPAAMFEAAWVLPCTNELDRSSQNGDEFLQCRSASHLTYVLVGLCCLSAVLIPVHRFSVMRLRNLSPDGWIASTQRDRHVTVRPLFLHLLLVSRVVKLCLVPVCSMLFSQSSPWLVGTVLAAPVALDLCVCLMCFLPSTPVISIKALMRPMQRIYLYVLLLDFGLAVIVSCRDSGLDTGASLEVAWWILYGVCVVLPLFTTVWREKCASMRSCGHSWVVNDTTDDDTVFDGEVRPVF